MPNDNVLIQTADSREKLFIMALWKLAGAKVPPESINVLLDIDTIKAFTEAYGVEQGKEPMFIMQGTEDGLLIKVMTDEAGKRFLDEYRAGERGIIIDPTGK